MKYQGTHVIFPVDSFYQNGHFWSVTKRFDIQYLVPYGEIDRDKWKQELVNPKLELNDLGIQTLGQDEPCNCQECIEGRKKVESGWRPCIIKYEKI